MKNIVLTRVDDRLIHGQVMTAWVKHTECNEIIIVDDNVSKDEFLKKILKEAAPIGIKIHIYSISEAIKYLFLDDDDKRLMILVRDPYTIYKLIKHIVNLGDIIIGGISARKDRIHLYKNISASAEERNILKEVISSGITIKIRIMPDDKGINVYKYL
ncbi:PTS sugar transporter subunit IIB [Clostridium sp.]|uniref:PTS system mannose/fructose/N-acetylgalactosamine-transporter subunit IIB n=1 Tax=Clostridium sp. TaxID=1506 RepID=UPI00290E29D0|nr:PTS sugar transporter subunit IIB [Clostridium sp.]MDU5107296.1 PTS sugar transporter subunit IIB [Clostridium sp.]